jgi:hypothetical protein
MGYHPDIETDGVTRSTLKLDSGRCIILTKLNKVGSLKMWRTQREALVAESSHVSTILTFHSRSSVRQEKDLVRQHGQTDRKDYTGKVTKWY